MQENFCQSCGMPMGETSEMYGTESNGSKSTDYCKNCYDNGAFTNPNCTLEEQIEFVTAVMVKNFGFSSEDARKQCNEGIPHLKRWKKLIAYCGLDCAECPAYIATISNDQTLREKAAAEFAENFGFVYTPEMINCVGCTVGGALLPHCSDCEIRKCASKKSVIHCGVCAEFKTCKLINDFIAKAPEVVDNLR